MEMKIMMVIMMMGDDGSDEIEEERKGYKHDNKRKSGEEWKTKHDIPKRRRRKKDA